MTFFEKEPFYDKNKILVAVGGEAVEKCNGYAIRDFGVKSFMIRGNNASHSIGEVTDNIFSKFKFELYAHCRVVGEAKGTTTTVVTSGKVAILRYMPHMRMTSGVRPEECNLSIIRATDGFNWVNHEGGEQYVIFTLDEIAEVYQMQRETYDPAKEIVIEIPDEIGVRNDSIQLSKLQKDFWLQYYALKHICENGRI